MINIATTNEATGSVNTKALASTTNSSTMSINVQSAPITRLPPEIYPLVASNLPLQSLPTTLSALSLTANQLYTMVQPVLYAKVIIRDEDQAHLMLERIVKDEPLGLLIRELHIMADFSPATLKKHNEETILTRLHTVIKKGRICHIRNLRVVLLRRWSDFECYNRLPQEFFEDLERNCPSIRGLFLQGIGDTEDDPWMDTSRFYDLKGLSSLGTLGLKFNWGCPRDGGAEKIFNSLSNLTSLHTLVLSLANSSPSVTPVLSLTLPCLKSLELSGFILYESEVGFAMEFWTRHQGLERLILTQSSERWFSDNVEPGLLPNLIHLQAYWSDVRAMLSHLPQLRFLSINQSDNGQIPYLLRSLLPHGLPDLISLEINQRPSSERDIRNTEGAMWYETENGLFKQETVVRKAYREMTDKYYMPSIVRGAPNLKELCLQGFPLDSKSLAQKRLAPALSSLPRLERFYYRAFGNSHSELSRSDIDSFIAGCRPLAEACRSLESVTNISMTELILPYHAGKIIRDQNGTTTEIVPARGFGLQYLGGDEDPFPQNPLPI